MFRHLTAWASLVTTYRWSLLASKKPEGKVCNSRFPFGFEEHSPEWDRDMDEDYPA
jgi:hypothetical protein